MKSRVHCVVGLGANLPSSAGDPRAALEAALAALPSVGLRPLRSSQWVSSPAYPPGSGPDFVNGAALVETELDPGAALAALHRVEAEAGRERVMRYAPRTLDLDLLVWGDQVAPDLETLTAWIALPRERWTETAPSGLILPHPRLQDRAFALGPLVDVWPDWRHPALGRSARELFEALPEADRASLRPL